MSQLLVLAMHEIYIYMYVFTPSVTAQASLEIRPDVKIEPLALVNTCVRIRDNQILILLVLFAHLLCSIKRTLPSHDGKSARK